MSAPVLRRISRDEATARAQALGYRAPTQSPYVDDAGDGAPALLREVQRLAEHPGWETVGAPNDGRVRASVSRRIVLPDGTDIVVTVHGLDHWPRFDRRPARRGHVWLSASWSGDYLRGGVGVPRHTDPSDDRTLGELLATGACHDPGRVFRDLAFALADAFPEPAAVPA